MKLENRKTTTHTSTAPEAVGEHRAKQACEKIAQLARRSADGAALIAELNDRLQRELFEMRRLGDAASSAEGAHRKELLLKLGEQALRVSDVNNELRTACAAYEQEQSKNRAEVRRYEVEIEEGRIEEAAALLTSARELVARAKALLG